MPQLETLSVVLLSIFGAVCLLHLFFCFFELEVLRKISKPICLALLFFFVLSIKSDAVLVLLGIAFGCLGDIFLIWKRKKSCLISGVFSFMLGHFFYGAQLLLLFNLPYNYYYAGIIGACFVFIIILVFALYPKTKYLAHKSAYAGNAYFATLLILLIMSIVYASLHFNGGISLMVVFGYSLFIVSDSILTLTTYVKDVKRRDFYIMATYLPAELLISFGLVLLLVAL